MSRSILEDRVNHFFEILVRKKIIKIVSSNLAILPHSSEEPYCIYIHYEEFEIDNNSLSDFGKLNAGGRRLNER